MKIKFLNGVAGYRGAMVTPHGRGMVAGFCTGYRYSNEREVVVVKQRSIWFTILILIHELAHYVAGKLFSGDMKRQVNKWVDKHMIRRRDKK